MPRKRRKNLGSDESVHARELVVSRNAIRSSVRAANAKLDVGDCVRADSELRRATYFEGQANVHHDASTPFVAAGYFRDSTEARELNEATRRFRAVCVRDRIKKG